MNTDMLKRIEKAMEAKGLTKAEMSKLAGLSPTFLRDLFPDTKTGEVRKKSVSYDNLLAIAEVLDTTPEWLAEGRGITALQTCCCAGGYPSKRRRQTSGNEPIVQV